MPHLLHSHTPSPSTLPCAARCWPAGQPPGPRIHCEQGRDEVGGGVMAGRGSGRHALLHACCCFVSAHHALGRAHTACTLHVASCIVGAHMRRSQAQLLNRAIVSLSREATQRADEGLAEADVPAEEVSACWTIALRGVAACWVLGRTQQASMATKLPHCTADCSTNFPAHVQPPSTSAFSQVHVAALAAPAHRTSPTSREAPPRRVHLAACRMWCAPAVTRLRRRRLSPTPRRGLSPTPQRVAALPPGGRPLQQA